MDLLIPIESTDNIPVRDLVLKSLESNNNAARHVFLQNQEIFYFVCYLLDCMVDTSMCLKFGSVDTGIHLTPS